VDRNRLVGSADLVGDATRSFNEQEARKELAARPLRTDLSPDPGLPTDTRLWAALQAAGGGTWGGCVYDVERIVELLDAGRKALNR
jgi:hypothetical protein